MEAAIHVKPFGFDRVFQMTGGESPDFDARGFNDRIDALEARIETMRETHREELARARADSYEEGLSRARQERDTALLAASDAIHAAIDDIDARLADTTDAMMKDAAAVALAAADMLAGHAVEQARTRAIEEALDRVLRQVAADTRLTIRVHPALTAGIDRLIATRAGQERRQLAITVVADEDVAEGDARIFWEEGGLTIDAPTRRAAVLAELGPLIGKDGVA